jgi:hypothetical protein
MQMRISVVCVVLVAQGAHGHCRSESFQLERGSVFTYSISLVENWVSFVHDE